MGLDLMREEEEEDLNMHRSSPRPPDARHGSAWRAFAQGGERGCVGQRQAGSWVHAACPLR